MQGISLQCSYVFMAKLDIGVCWASFHCSTARRRRFLNNRWWLLELVIPIFASAVNVERFPTTGNGVRALVRFTATTSVRRVRGRVRGQRRRWILTSCRHLKNNWDIYNIFCEELVFSENKIIDMSTSVRRRSVTLVILRALRLRGLEPEVKEFVKSNDMLIFIQQGYYLDHRHTPVGLEKILNTKHTPQFLKK